MLKFGFPIPQIIADHMQGIEWLCISTVLKIKINIVTQNQKSNIVHLAILLINHGLDKILLPNKLLAKPSSIITGHHE